MSRRDERLRRVAARTQPGHDIPAASELDAALDALMALPDDEFNAEILRLAPSLRDDLRGIGHTSGRGTPSANWNDPRQVIGRRSRQ